MGIICHHHTHDGFIGRLHQTPWFLPSGSGMWNLLCKCLNFAHETKRRCQGVWHGACLPSIGSPPLMTSLLTCWAGSRPCRMEWAQYSHLETRRGSGHIWAGGLWNKERMCEPICFAATGESPLASSWRVVQESWLGKNRGFDWSGKTLICLSGII